MTEPSASAQQNQQAAQQDQQAAQQDQQAAQQDQQAAGRDVEPARAEPGRGDGMSDAPTFIPPTDIIETKDAILMLLDVPGAEPESLDVTLERRTLRVWARSSSYVPEGYALVHAEFRDGNYERLFALSDQVDSERIDAVFKDGVLRLTLPKVTESPAKKIQVKAA